MEVEELKDKQSANDQWFYHNMTVQHQGSQCSENLDFQIVKLCG